MTADRHRINWLIAILFWLAVTALYAVRAVTTGGASPLIADTDDAMRLVVVNDLLHGQNWFDHVQHRLNTPFGAEIHWSRFIDLPLAGLQLLLTPFLGADAYFGAAVVWPLLLLFVLLALSAAFATHFTGRDGLLPGLVLPVLSAVVLVEFAPGRADHHNVQIILSLLMAFATVRSWSSPNFAIVAGLAAATSLAVGLETLPVIVPAVAAFALGYVLVPETARQMRLFGLSFASGAVAHLMLAWPPARWLEPACDALSITYVAAALGVGLVFLILPLLPRGNAIVRLGLGGLLGAALVAGLVAAFPACLAGPYAGMDPWLAEHWLARIIEAKPVWYSFGGLPAYTVGIMLPPLAALVVLGFILNRTTGLRRAEWATLGLFLLVGLMITVLQIRGARLVAPMIVPVGAWLIVAARARYLSRQNLVNIVALAGSWLIFAGLAIALVTGWIVPKGSDEIEPVMATAATQPAGNRYQCLMPGAFEDLSALPPERIMAPVDLGAHILLFTDHAVVGAPYHRNQEGVLDTFNFFNRPLDEAREILDERGISLVVTCPWLNEMQGFEDTAEDSFVRRVARNDLPNWLEDVSLLGATLKTYVVTD